MEKCADCTVGHEICLDDRCRGCADFDTACNSTLQKQCYAYCEDILQQEIASKDLSIAKLQEKLEDLLRQNSEYKNWSYVFYIAIGILAIGLVVMLVVYIKEKLSQKEKNVNRTDAEAIRQESDHEERNDEEKQLLENTKAVSVEVDETKSPDVAMPQDGTEEQGMVDSAAHLKQIKPRDDPNDSHYKESQHQFLPSGTV